ncbi:Arylamine N-acetyltransferase [Alteribacillus persepolensis]|uniref:Arylamine N-acetyltransferase n=1 Tax=Alteribacillus persepolensis TaxID=568899 RepID=A0A1G8DAU4_9BACI|nr:arylamine N-acetyltransferase [Alteribacillus persepolensis]SDH54918.1 Arylamine N-acetyltransferase [Alteribacillus persepolensis]
MHSWTNDYLDTLQLKRETPSKKYLKKIIRAHVRTFPFENVSKLWLYERYQDKAPIPSVEQFLEGYWKYQTGGTCFALNACLFDLLTSLGFEGYLIRPGEEHMAMIIYDPDVKGRRLYVDVGTTAPLFDPIPFQGRKQLIPPFAGEKLLFLPGSNEGEYTYIRVRGGQIIDKKWTFSIYDSVTREDFKPFVKATFREDAVFMNVLRCQRWEPEKRRGLSLVNRKFMIKNGNGGVLTKTISDENALRQVLNEEFHMPKLPVSIAVEVLQKKGIHLF